MTIRDQNYFFLRTYSLKILRNIKQRFLDQTLIFYMKRSSEQVKFCPEAGQIRQLYRCVTLDWKIDVLGVSSGHPDATLDLCTIPGAGR